ncbi:MAG: hypothetical protein SR1Q5_05475 [Quinella sp. 1Q5]|nr:hypothetical protein [Quinella sp. 1Q5]
MKTVLKADLGFESAFEALKVILSLKKGFEVDFEGQTGKSEIPDFSKG